MIDDIVSGLTVKDRKIIEVTFNIASATYNAAIGLERINVTQKNNGFRNNGIVAFLKLGTAETRWYFEHMCGLSGYNPMMGDNCQACASKGNPMEERELITSMLSGYTKYSPKLADAIRAIPDYCRDFEVRNFPSRS